MGCGGAAGGRSEARRRRADDRSHRGTRSTTSRRSASTWSMNRRLRFQSSCVSGTAKPAQLWSIGGSPAAIWVGRKTWPATTERSLPSDRHLEPAGRRLAAAADADGRRAQLGDRLGCRHPVAPPEQGEQRLGVLGCGGHLLVERRQLAGEDGGKGLFGPLVGPDGVAEPGPVLGQAGEAGEILVADFALLVDEGGHRELVEDDHDHWRRWLDGQGDRLGGRGGTTPDER